MLLILFEGGGHYSRGLHRRGIFLVGIKSNCIDPELKAYLKHFFSFSRVNLYLAGMKSQFFAEIMTRCGCLHIGSYFHSDPFLPSTFG